MINREYGKELCALILGEHKNNSFRSVIAFFILSALRLGADPLKLGRFFFRLFLQKDTLRAILGFTTIERATEYQWLLSNLKNDAPLKILDMGCSMSLLGFELVSMKHDVYGVDAREYTGKPPGFKFFKTDAAKLPFADGYFDRIAVISTLEHIGMGAFNDPKYKDADAAALRELKRVLAPNGALYLSVPYCAKYTVTWQRYYDRGTLRGLLNGNFETVSEILFLRKGSRWAIVEEKDITGVGTDRTNCIACLKLKKTN